MNVKTGVVTVSIIIITNNVVTGDDCIDQYQEVKSSAGHAVIMSSQSCNKCHHCHTVFTINNVTSGLISTPFYHTTSDLLQRRNSTGVPRSAPVVSQLI